MNYNRRKFISFIGKASLGSVIAPQFLINCGSNTTPIKQLKTDSKERLEVLKNLVLTVTAT